MTSDVELEKEYSITFKQVAFYFVFLGALFGLVIVLDNRLPTPLTLQDESKCPSCFIAERAQNNLLTLTENGSRIVGSFENEIGAVNFLRHELMNIISTTYRKVEIDIQTVNGSYYIDFKPFGGYNFYGNVQNVIAKVFSKNVSKYSILVNAHFDSVPTSPGGSDDGIMCVVMLEVLRKLCQSQENFLYNIIFLFNGAEETPLQASHGFITQHNWAKDIKVVVNLEAAGSGHKAILFQSGPGHSWLLNYYSKIPHPYGQVAGEEIFQSNLIPSDTDFRVFRDYGNVVGFDLAFFKNGYRYHTSYDDVNSIPLGSYQHVGDNVLALVKSLANAPEIVNMDAAHGKAIYFDVFNLFMVSYKNYVGIIINTLVILVSCLVSYKGLQELGRGWRSIVYIGATTVVMFIGWGLACVGIISIGILIDSLNYSMSWYNRPYLVLGLFAIPTIIFSSLPLIGWNYFNKKLHFSRRVQTDVQSTIVRLIWTVILLVMTILRIRSAYALMIPILFNTLGSIAIHLTKHHYSANTWKIIYLSFNAFPTMMFLYQSIMILSLFIPLTGRIGNEKNSEIIVGIITMALTVIMSSFYIQFLTLVKKPLWLMYIFLVLFLITFLMMVSPLGFPYSSDPAAPAPQRFMIYHTKRIFHNEEGIVKQDSGYFVANLDRNSPQSVIPYVRQFGKAVPLKDDCRSFLACGLPIFSPRMLSILEGCTWIPAEEPNIDENISLDLDSKTFLKPNLLSFAFTATGPDHFNVYLSPRSRTRLVNVSLDSVIPENVVTWNGRPVYFLNFAWGVSKMPFQFTVDLEVPDDWTSASMDIAISGKYVHDKRNQHTMAFKAFLADFPKWANIAPAIANFESWEI